MSKEKVDLFIFNFPSVKLKIKNGGVIYLLFY